MVMSFQFDNAWTRHPTVDTEEGETIEQLSKRFGEATIRFSEYSNPFGVKMEAELFCHSPSLGNIYPHITIWCTSMDKQKVIDYLLETWNRLKDHPLSSGRP